MRVMVDTGEDVRPMDPKAETKRFSLKPRTVVYLKSMALLDLQLQSVQNMKY